MNNKTSHSLGIALWLAVMLMLMTGTVLGQTRTIVGQNSSGCAADSINPACKSDASPRSSSNSSRSYSDNAARTEAIATGVMTLIDLFNKSPEEEARDAEARARAQAAYQEQHLTRQYQNAVYAAMALGEAIARSCGYGQNKTYKTTKNKNKITCPSPAHSSEPYSLSAPMVDIRSSKEINLKRSECLKIIKNKSGSAYIGHLSVQNECSEPINYSFCYLSGGGRAWGDWQCEQNSQGQFQRGSDVVAAGDTAVLPSSLSSTVVAIAACAKHGLPFITSINQQQSGFICK